MRWCSRCAGVSSAVAAGCGVVTIRLGCWPKKRSPEQAPSASAAATAASRAVPRNTEVALDLASPKLTRTPSSVRSLLSDDLDLLGRGRLDPRAAARLDPPPHHHTPPRKRPRLHPGRSELLLMAL